MDDMEFYKIWSIKNTTERDGMFVQWLDKPDKRHYQFWLPNGKVFDGFLSRKNIKRIEPGIYNLFHGYRYGRNHLIIMFLENKEICVIHEYPEEFYTMCKENEKRTVNKMKYEDILAFFLM